MTVHTIGGNNSYLFSITQNYDVFQLYHHPKDLKKFTPSNLTLLWEPSTGPTPLKFSEIKCHITATLPPDEDRYKRFQNFAEMLYMPCSSELQIRLMGQILREVAYTLHRFPTDQLIHEHVLEFGPFIRSSLLWGKNKLKGFRSKQTREVGLICSSESILLSSLSSYDQIVTSKNKILEGCSRRLAMFSVKRSHPLRYYEHSMYFDFDNKFVVKSIYQRIARLDIDKLKKHLIKFNNEGLQFEAVLPKYLEQIFVAHSVSRYGFTWKAFRMRHRPHEKPNKTKRLKRCILNTNEQPISAQFDRIERAIITHDKMRSGVLYFPNDASFSLVDMYYKDADNNMIGIQPTIGQRHEKSFSVYESFYRKLSTTAEQSPLQMYYLILPRMLPQYAKGNYPPSQFPCDVTGNTNEVQKWASFIHFYILFPPDDFEATFPEDHA